MTGTNHGMTGAAIALLVKEPVAAIPLSFVSHFICDAIPHYGLNKGVKLFDRNFNTILAADFALAVCLMILLSMMFPSHKWLIWSCMITAASPDLMWAYYLLLIGKVKHRKPHFGLLARFHTWVQRSQTPKGWFVEAAWFFMMGAIILTIS